MRADDADQLLTTGDVARMLERSVDLVRLLERQGRLSAVRTLGGQRLFRLADVLALKTKRQVSCG